MGEINNFFFLNVIEPIVKYLNLTEILMIEREKEGVKKGGYEYTIRNSLLHFDVLMQGSVK